MAPHTKATPRTQSSTGLTNSTHQHYREAVSSQSTVAEHASTTVSDVERPVYTPTEIEAAVAISALQQSQYTPETIEAATILLMMRHNPVSFTPSTTANSQTASTSAPTTSVPKHNNKRKRAASQDSEQTEPDEKRLKEDSSEEPEDEVRRPLRRSARVKGKSNNQSNLAAPIVGAPQVAAQPAIVAPPAAPAAPVAPVAPVGPAAPAAVAHPQTAATVSISQTQSNNQSNVVAQAVAPIVNSFSQVTSGTTTTNTAHLPAHIPTVVNANLPTTTQNSIGNPNAPLPFRQRFLLNQPRALSIQVPTNTTNTAFRIATYPHPVNFNNRNELEELNKWRNQTLRRATIRLGTYVDGRK